MLLENEKACPEFPCAQTPGRFGWLGYRAGTFSEIFFGKQDKYNESPLQCLVGSVRALKQQLLSQILKGLKRAGKTPCKWQFKVEEDKEHSPQRQPLDITYCCPLLPIPTLLFNLPNCQLSHPLCLTSVVASLQDVPSNTHFLVLTSHMTLLV
jgi:hypothetical protein